MLNFLKYLIFFNSIWMKKKKKVKKKGRKILFFQFTSAQFKQQTNYGFNLSYIVKRSTNFDYFIYFSINKLQLHKNRKESIHSYKQLIISFQRYNFIAYVLCVNLCDIGNNEIHKICHNLISGYFRLALKDNSS